MMKRFSVSKKFENKVPISERVTMVCRMFGIDASLVIRPSSFEGRGPRAESPPITTFEGRRVTHSCEFEAEDGDIVYITGPSGAGKSVLLREIEKMVPADERISIDEICLPADKAAIDCISTDITTIGALQLLGYAGLSDVFCILTAPANLSEGQQYRYRLACALASGKKAVFSDEFCSNLDRITAASVAYNVRRFAKRNKVTFFLASSHEDILADLQPDVLVVKHLTGEAKVTYKKIKN